MGDWMAHCVLVTLTHCLVPYVSMQGPQQMQGTRVGEARLSWVLVFTLSSKLQQEVFVSGAPPQTEEEIKTHRGSRSKAAHHLRARAAQVPLLSLETRDSGLESLKAAAAKLHSSNMEHTGPQPQPSGSLGTV